MLKQLFGRLKQSYMDSIGYSVPERYQSPFVVWGGGLEVQHIYKSFLKSCPSGSRILIIGVMGGRDYFLFKNLGYEVTAMDLGPQPDIDNIIFANIEEELPFPDGYFDAIILGEVLEHLKQDAKALENLRRVIKPEGYLAVSVPFYQDVEEGHMRIHSPKSGLRLLNISGWKVVDYLERPGIFWLPTAQTYALSFISLLSWLLLRKTAYRIESSLIGRIEWTAGHWLWLRPLRRRSIFFGGYYLCQLDQAVDHIALNRDLYTQKAADVGSGR